MAFDDIQRYFHEEETKYVTHNFHSYPSKLVPQIARMIIQEFSKENDVILDPFCGSGTVLVEANLLKRNCIGIDINPLAYLISKVKTTPLEAVGLKKESEDISKKLPAILSNKESLLDFIKDKYFVTVPEIPNFPNRDYWFQKEPLIALSILKKLILGIKDKDLRDFYLVAFSSIIKSVSNASSLHKLTRKKNIKAISRKDVFSKFKNKLDYMTKKMEEYNKVRQNNFIKLHCKDFKEFELEEVDCIITNIPHFPAYFARLFKIHFWWLDLGHILKLDTQVLGTTRGDYDTKILDQESINARVRSLANKDKKISVALSHYFYDLNQGFKKFFKILKPNCYCCIYASDFNLHGKINCIDFLKQLAEDAGFVLERCIEREVPRKALVFKTHEKKENILIFKKTKN